MYRIKEKNGQSGSIVSKASDSKFYEALFWKDPSMIFTCSMSDFFIEEADKWRDEAWDVIRRTPQHIWQILTKRPERITKCLPSDWGNGWENVWLGTSIEKQKYMHRALTLSNIPAKVRFISAEPLLEEIDFLEKIDDVQVINSIRWIILGGETGNDWGKFRYRPSEVEWYEKAIKDLRTVPNMAIFVKQMGCHLRNTLKLKHYHGGDINEFPKNLQIREFPIDGIEHML
jgi:protein gp37